MLILCLGSVCYFFNNFWYKSELKLGQVIRIIQVNWVMFCLGQLGLTHFIKYPGLTQILHRITSINNVSR